MLMCILSFLLLVLQSEYFLLTYISFNWPIFTWTISNLLLSSAIKFLILVAITFSSRISFLLLKFSIFSSIMNIFSQLKSQSPNSYVSTACQGLSIVCFFSQSYNLLLWVDLHSPKFICWSPNSYYLRIWPDLEIVSLFLSSQVKVRSLGWNLIQYTGILIKRGNFG